MATQPDKGMSIFLDVFRRADKNDDGALSWEEFTAFFSDGVIGEAELKSLFSEIDTHGTNNLDTGELCEYFSKHLGPFKGIFSALEDLNSCISDSLLNSSKEYPGAAQIDKFITRFIMRESLCQFAALQRPLEAASDALDEQAMTESSSANTERAAGMDSAATPAPERQVSHEVDIDAGDFAGTGVPGRFGRRARRQMSSQSSWSEGGSGQLGRQVDRLKGMLDKLENKVNFDNITDEETVDAAEDNLMVMVSRRMRVNEDQNKAFRASLKAYVEAAGQGDGCLHIHVRSYAGTSSFALYEVWESEEEWKSFSTTAGSKNFRRGCIDYLEVPEQCSSMLVPGKWWRRI